MICEHCGNPASDGIKYCKHCGTPIAQVIYTPLFSDIDHDEKDQNPSPSVATMPVFEYPSKSSKAPDFDINQHTFQKDEKPMAVLLIPLLASGVFLLLVAIGALVYQHFNQHDTTQLVSKWPYTQEKIKFENTSNDSAIIDSANSSITSSTEPILTESLRFIETELICEPGDIINMTSLLEMKSIIPSEIIWKSDNDTSIRITQNGILEVLSENQTAHINATSINNSSISVNCQVTSISVAESFVNQVTLLNKTGATLERITTHTGNHTPAERNFSAQWDKTLFYSLEEIFQDSDTDGKINGYDLEKKQLINAETGNKIEFELYRNPATGLVNKITSIEYQDAFLEISDYYYTDEGKINFIFVRRDVVYVPTYAAPSMPGERFYFNNDTMLKWRVVTEDKKLYDYPIGEAEPEKVTAGTFVIKYADMSADQKKRFDDNEIRMINAAYNTFNTVLNAKGISSINGYVTDVNGAFVPEAAVKLYSEELDIWAYETITNENGQYAIVVPSNDDTYQVKVDKAGFVETDIYGIDMSRQVVGTYQESVCLVPDTGKSFRSRILINDAFNISQSGYTDEFGRMLRLDHATLHIRKGINNRKGDVIYEAVSDGSGIAELELGAGNYTVELQKDGYETSFYTITAKQDDSLMQINATPKLNENEVRIVLTWNQFPNDLDSHLFTPYTEANSSAGYHIWYGRKNDASNNNLDVDDVDGYGPETMTINMLTDGLYKYYVVDYSNCRAGAFSSTAMASSDATVSVYTKDGLVQTFHVPANRQGVIWEVFEIRNKRIAPIQRYYNSVADKKWWNSDK